MSTSPQPKADLKKELEGYRAKAGEFRTLELPPRRYLMVDGSGDPNTSRAFAAAIETLFPVAYKLKFASTRELGRDYTVMPLEGLWWADDPSVFTTRRNKDSWQWTLMVLVPDWTTDEQFAAAVAASADAPAIDRIRLEVLDEGTVIQTLHLGSFDDEGPVLAKLHDEVIPERGFEPAGRHHEIYLSDLRRTGPAKLRTIVRQSVRART